MRSGFLILGFVLLSACAGRDESHVQETADEASILNVYNWADYIGKSTIADFEARTGIKVNYDVYDTSEVLETKLLTGSSGYDIVVPSVSRAEALIGAGAFRKLDKSKFTNLSNLDPHFMRTLATYDPDNAYGLPYLWGTAGIGYNPDMVEKILGTRTIDSLSAVFDPTTASKLEKCGITILNAPETVFTMAYIYLGLDANSARPEDLAAAEALLTKVRPYVRYFDSSRYVNDLASGEVCISIGWSWGVKQAQLRGLAAQAPVEVVYVIPKEGAPLWADLIGIPADAPHADNAHMFLDYLMEPKVIAGITNEVRAANGNLASLPFVAEDIRSDVAVYLPEQIIDGLSPEKQWSHETVREVTRAWTRIRSGQ